MIETGIDHRPSTLSVKIAGGSIALFGTAVAATRGLLAVAVTLAGLVGALAVIWGWSVVAVDPGATPHRETALASIAVTLGGVGLLAPLFWLSPGGVALLVPFVWAALFVGMEGTGNLKSESTRWLTRLCWRSRDFAFLSMLVVLALDAGSVLIVAVGTVETASVVLGLSLSWALAILFAEVYLAMFFLPRAQAVLEERAGMDAERGIHGIVVGNRPLDELLEHTRKRLNKAYEGIGLVLAVLITGSQVWDAILLQIPVFGSILWVTLTSGVLHAPLALVVLAAFVTVALGQFHAWIVTNRALDPAQALASGTGGVVLGLLLLPSVLVPDSVSRAVFPPALETAVTGLGPGAVILGGIALVLLVVPILLLGAPIMVSWFQLAEKRTSGFLTAALLVVFGTVIAALVSVPTILVFVGVALALLTWDFGEQAVFLGQRLGRDVDTDSPELVHAFGSFAVGVVGVVLATVMAFVVGPIRVPADSSRAFVALALALVAALGFSLSLSRSS